MTHSYDYKLYAIKMEYFQKKINTNKVFIPDIAKKWSKQGESNTGIYFFCYHIQRFCCQWLSIPSFLKKVA